MGGSFSEALLRTTLWLGVLLVAIFLLAWLAQRLGLAGPSRGRDKKGVRILSRTAIDPRKAILLLWVRGRVLVVGVTPTEISLLTELPEEEEPEEAETGAFPSRLAKALNDSGIVRTAH